MDTDKQSPTKSISILRWIVLVLSLGLIVLAFFSLGAIRKQAIFEEQNAESVAKMQKQVTSLTKANHQLTFELEQLKGRDTMASIDEVWQRKFDSIERLNFYNSVSNHIEALNESTLTKAREDSQKLYDDYLTHINTIIAFFSIIIAVISVFVPYLINRKTDEVVKEHDKKLKELIKQINESAEKAKQSADETLALSEIASNNNTARTFMAKGEYDRALDYYKTAVIECETKLGKDHPNTAATYNNIANAYYYKGDYDEALEYLMKALEIRETKLGKDHSDTAETYNDIATMYYSKNVYDKALEYFGKALEIVKIKLGENHPNTASTYNNIANVYHSKGDYNTALEFYLKALAISESRLGKDHPDTATTYYNIAVVYDAKGEYDNALDYYIKAIKVWLNRDYRHPDAKSYFGNMKSCYEESKNEKPFKDWMKEQLDEKEWEAFLKLVEKEKVINGE